MIASYGDEDHDINCLKKRDRQTFLNKISLLVADAIDKPNDPSQRNEWEKYLILMGDMNINGNPHRPVDDSCLDSEWASNFDPVQATIPVNSCGDVTRAECKSTDRIMVDAWAFDTSKEDIGWTNGDKFTIDPGNPGFPKMGKRLDYILYRSPSPSAVNKGERYQMIPQHMTIEWPLIGEKGNLSDHLPVAVNLFIPQENIVYKHTTPRIAHDLLVPLDGTPATANLEIQFPGQMQWVRLNGDPGTYSVKTWSNNVDVQGIGFVIYKPTDLSRPIQPRRKNGEHGIIYLLNDPPYFIRTYVGKKGGGDDLEHDRTSVSRYGLRAKRHNCTDYLEACILDAGDKGLSVDWPDRPVNTTDTMWFEFLADNSDDLVPPFHRFLVTKQSGSDLPAFIYTIADILQPNNDLVLNWDTIENTADQQSKEVMGVKGTGGHPGHKNWFLKIQRPDWEAYTGAVQVAHQTNLTYWLPQNIQVVQEYDDSPLDELWLYSELLGSVPHQGLTQGNIHNHAAYFDVLPEIDELEDGGRPWPASRLGRRTYSTELPLILIEDDDEDGDHEEGDFLLARLGSGNLYQTGSGRAITTLPLDKVKDEVRWYWSDKNPPPGRSG